MPVAQKYEDGCLVEVAPNGIWEQLKSSFSNDSNDLTCSTSGLLISPQHGYVITHASVLVNYLSDNRDILKRLKNTGHIPSKTVQGLKALVTLERKKESSVLPAKDNTNSDSTKSYFRSLLNFTKSSRVDTRQDQCVGHIELIWKSKQLAKVLKTFLPLSDQWSFFEESHNPDNNGSNKNDVDPQLIAQLLPFFVLIKLDKWKKHDNSKTCLYDGMVKMGDTVHLVGTPFASMSPSVFFNSLSQGLVCNVAGQHQELILTDARCIPGTEGGPLYFGSANRRNCVLGIVISALCWKANEWIGLSLVCNISEIIHSLSGILQLPEMAESFELVCPLREVSSNPRVPLVTPDTSPVVLVKNAGSWGSGIIVDQSAGLVVTCGHVVKNSKTVKVRVDIPNVEWYDATVLHATPVNHAFDIGVLLLKNYKSRGFWPDRINIAQDPKEGDASFVVGHAMFGHHLNLKPTVTSGIVSKVIKFDKSPVIIQSTCTVNAGASGGPLVSANGSVIGIVTCNAKDTGTGAAFPHVNLSVPMQTIWNVIGHYLETGDQSVFDVLQICNKEINDMWSMNGSTRTYDMIACKL